MKWLKMSPEYRVHTAIGHDGYEGPVPWMKTKQEILAENLKKIEETKRQSKVNKAINRLKKLQNKIRIESSDLFKKLLKNT